MKRNGFIYRAFDLYYDGFRHMKLGKTLWTIIAIKLDDYRHQTIYHVCGAEGVLLPELPETTCRKGWGGGLRDGTVRESKQ